MLTALDLAGVFVSALSGGMLAVRKRLDSVGVLALAIAAGTAGGLLRDLLIGDVPPPALRDWRYIAVCCCSGLISFALLEWPRALVGAVRVCDAFALGLFAAAGASKGVSAGLGPVSCVTLGVVTAVGGGLIRDVLAGEVPMVFRREIYATAAALGAIVIVVSERWGASAPAAVVAGGAITIVVRLLAIRFDWHAPRRRRRPLACATVGGDAAVSPSARG